MTVLGIVVLLRGPGVIRVVLPLLEDARKSANWSIQPDLVLLFPSIDGFKSLL